MNNSPGLLLALAAMSSSLVRVQHEKYPGQRDYRRWAWRGDGVPSKVRVKERKPRTR